MSFGCKVCDLGVVVPRKISRMSGPAVAIGYILLVPSVFGMIASALIFFGVITYNGGESSAVNEQNFPASFDTDFRRRCASSFAQNYRQSAGESAPPLLIAEYCECASAALKESGSASMARESCAQQLNAGALIIPDRRVQDFYSNVSEESGPTSRPATGLFRVIGGGFAIFWGIVFFVGGLLGWLLTMKKRVLQCTVCGAVINAS
jgi:hypothetical protein